MKRRMKKIIAFVCALTVFAASAAGWNLAQSVEAADGSNTEATPITLDGFTTISVDDFVGEGNVAMEGKTYTEKGFFSLKDLDSYNKTLVSFRMKYETGEHSTRLEIAGKDSNSAFMIHPNGDGTKLVFTQSTWSDTTKLANDPYFTMSAQTAGLDSFVNEEFVMQISVEYIDNDNGGTANDVRLGFYFNGVAYKFSENVTTTVISNCYMDRFGDYLTVYTEGTGISVNAVGVTSDEEALPSVSLPGFTTISVDDFVGEGNVAMEGKTYTEKGFFSLKDLDSYNKTLVSFRMKYETGAHSTRLEIAGKDSNSAFMIHPNGDGTKLVFTQSTWSDTTKLANDPYFTMSAQTAGLDSFINEEFVMQISVEYIDNDNGGTANDVRLGFYFNGVAYKFSENVTTTVISNCYMDRFGDYLTVYTEGTGISVNAVDTTTEEGELPSVTLDGFTTISTDDFVDASENVMQSKKYTSTETFTLKEYENYNRKLLTFKVKFEGTGTNSRIEFLGADDTAFYYVYPSSTSMLRLHPNGGNTITNMTDPYFGLDFSNLPEGTVSSAINEEYMLQISTEYKEDNQVQISVYVNGECVRACVVDSCNMDKFGNRLTIRVDGSPIAITGVETEGSNGDGGSEGSGNEGDGSNENKDQIQLEGFRTISVDDFVDASENKMQSKKYTSTETFTLKEYENYDKKLLTFKVKFEGTGTDSRIEFLGMDDTAFYYLYPASTSALRLHPNGGNTITNMAEPYFGLDLTSLPAGTVTSAINEEYMLQISTEYQESNVVEVGVYINGELVSKCVIDNCNMDKFGNRLTIRVEGSPITITGVETEGSNDDGGNEGGGNEGSGNDEPKEPIQLDGFRTISVSDFIDASGNGMQGKIYMNTSSYTLKDLDSFDKTLLSFKTTYTKGTTNLRIEFAGKDTTSAFIVYVSADGNKLYFTQSSWDEAKRLAEDPFNAIDATKAGVESFLNKEVIIQLSIEYGDFEGNDGADDMRLGFYFDGKAYPFDDGTNYKIIKNCNMNNFGDMLTIYSDGDPIAIYGLDAETGGEINIPEMSGPLSEDCKKITLKHFGIEDGTYGHNPDDGFAVEGKTRTSLAKTAVCGEMLLKSGDEYTICSSGKGGWQGLFIKVSAKGNFTACWRNATVEKVFFGRGTIPMDEWVDFMFSTEVMDIDGDGAEDDIKLGIWINGELMEGKYFPATDCAEDLGNFFGIYCREGYTVSLKSIPELIEPFDYSVYGLTENWASTLLNTGLSAEIPVGGSKESGPFSGDYTAIMLYAVAFVISLGGLGFYGYRRKKNER